MTNTHPDNTRNGGRGAALSRPRRRDHPQQVRFLGRETTCGRRAEIVEAERDVTHLFSWSCERIPALVQSEHYMLTQFAPRGPVDIAAPRTERRSRQRLFDTNPGASYEFILSESALDRLVGSMSPALALDQLDHMLGLLNLHPNVGIRVVPYTAALYVDHGFTSLRFADPVRNFAYAETPLGLGQVTRGNLATFKDSQDALQYIALSVPETARTLATKAFALRQRGTQHRPRAAAAATPRPGDAADTED